MPIITLTTDFGTRDGYVGAMKGVIAREAPAAAIARTYEAVGEPLAYVGSAGTIEIAIRDGRGMPVEVV